MRIASTLAAGLVALMPLAAHPADLQSVEQLRQQIGMPAQAIKVYEPHLSVGDRHVAVDYVGYPAIDMFEHVFGKDWQDQAQTIEFRALDGYVARIDAARFLKDRAYLVFAKQDNAPFTVDNLQQNQSGVPLGPWYLVWDTYTKPALLEEGAGNWPYQVKEIGLVTVSTAALLPKGLEARFHEGADLVRKHCLACHKVNGYGGEKFEGDLAELMKDYPEADFFRLVLTPATEREGATMPPISVRLPNEERRRIAGVVFDYLQAVPVLP